jgi:hypothetical protein
VAWLPERGWAFVVLLQLLLVGSAWLAVQTGEDQEERVERVVAERRIEDHEERAERLLVAAGIALAVIGAGLAPGRVGALARPLGSALSLGVAALAADVGHSGGLLVCEHGAAEAYTRGAASADTWRAQKLIERPSAASAASRIASESVGCAWQVAAISAVVASRVSARPISATSSVAPWPTMCAPTICP